MIGQLYRLVSAIVIRREKITMNTVVLVIIFCYVIMAVITINLVEGENRTRYTSLKTITSFLFLAIGLAAYRVSGRDLYMEFLPAYVCCFAGDVCLATARDAEGKLNTKNFLMGLGMFALAHVFFIKQFIALEAGKLSMYAIAFGLIIPAANIIASRTKKYNYGKKIIACAIYGVLIGLVGGFGLEFMINGQTDYLRFIGLSAFLFMCSDTIIGIKYFRINSPAVRKRLGRAELTLYYMAMLGLSTFTLLIA